MADGCCSEVAVKRGSSVSLFYAWGANQSQETGEGKVHPFAHTRTHTHTHTHTLPEIAPTSYCNIILQDSVNEAVSHTKQHYEDLLQLVRSELTAKHEQDKLSMAGEIQQLEARVANILREQQRSSDGGVSSLSGGSETSTGAAHGWGKPASRTYISEMDLQQLRPLIQTAMTNVKQDMLVVVSALSYCYCCMGVT